MRRAVFLDRDGVINRVFIRNGRSYPPPSLAEFELFPGVPEAVAALKETGFLVIVATNQPDLATGVQRWDVVHAMHERLRRELQVDDIKVCCHTDSDFCECRKPRPGMLLEAAREWDIDLEQSWMIGDRWRDVGAGQAAGCKTIWLQTDYDDRLPENPDAIVDSLLEASAVVLGEFTPKRLHHRAQGCRTEAALGKASG